jgi:Na+-transporting NADH:ubiquinone oxidoreductase subunit B
MMGRLRHGLLYPFFEAVDAFFRTPGTATASAPHVRDAMDLKRVMMIVVYALLPCVLFALYNTGYQANLALLEEIGESAAEGWRGSVMTGLGIAADPESTLSNFLHGALFFLPLYAVSFVFGAFWEALFAVVRRHRITEGFIVTSLIFALVLPPTAPWWQAALGISFGVVIGKEVFGGVGMNILNPALVGRAFLFFAYPARNSGDEVWIAVDGITQATPLAEFEEMGATAATWMDAFLGFIPGSMGETSTLACRIGAFILIVTGIGSWRVMAGVLAGAAGLALLFNAVGSETNEMFALGPLWHFVVGGFAFGTVFMATDPVTSARTEKGQLIYGLLIGLLTVLIRVVNPAYIEGMMMAILFANVFAPVIDKAVVHGNVARRRMRSAA